MSSGFPLLRPEQLTPEQRRLYEHITAGPRAAGPFTIVHDDGALAGPFNALLFAPRIGDAVQQLGSVLRFSGELPDRTRELVICAVAVALGSEYEWDAHSRVALRAGIAAAELEQVAAGRIPDAASETEATALELARQLIAEVGVTADMLAKAEEQLGRAGMTELTVLVGYYRTLAALLVVADVDAPASEARQQSAVDPDEKPTTHPSRMQRSTP